VNRALDLRLIVITDRAAAAPRPVRGIVATALAAGAPAIQLRDKEATPAELLQQTYELLALVRARGARLFVNDRLDVALAAGADGVHLGPDDLPVAVARRIAPPGFFIGYSTDDPRLALDAERDGASYIGCGAVFGSSTKHDVAGEHIGTARLDEVARAVTIPVVGIGGITVSNIAQVAATRAAGAAVVSAVMSAADPAAVTRELLRGFPRVP
jgi:thiamine-phosphate pyrophosphorylase